MTPALAARARSRPSARRLVAASSAARARSSFSDYWIAALLTQMLFLGIVAASLIFLSAYGGMVSLAQVAIYGIAGFALGNLTTNGNTKGLNLGWDPGAGIAVAILVALPSRSSSARWPAAATASTS